MLVITRREGEEIYISVPDGNDVLRVKISSIKGNQVQLGISAPREYGVDRKEVYESKHKQDSRGER